MVASSRAARANVVSAAPGVEQILCCMKVWALMRAWSFSPSAAATCQHLPSVPIPEHWQVAAASNTAPAATDAASNCSWVTCAFPWVGMWAAELFLCLSSLSPNCNWLLQAPSAPSRAHGITNVKHRTLAGKRWGFSLPFFFLSKFFKPYLPIIALLVTPHNLGTSAEIIHAALLPINEGIILKLDLTQTPMTLRSFQSDTALHDPFSSHKTPIHGKIISVHTHTQLLKYPFTIKHHHPVR